MIMCRECKYLPGFAGAHGEVQLCVQHAASTEQLTELRRVAGRALKYIETDPVLDYDGIEIMQALRAVLNPKPEKEMQS